MSAFLTSNASATSIKGISEVRCENRIDSSNRRARICVLLARLDTYLLDQAIQFCLRPVSHTGVIVQRFFSVERTPSTKFRRMFDKKTLTSILTGKSSEKPTEEGEGNKEEAKPKRQESFRDTFESILFAFVLAFLFRTFEAEAFVIPTGSMAPTLYGRHKETTCTQCGFHITVGASDEVIRGTGLLGNGARVKTAICPNCAFENEQIYDELAFNGDRILVNKYPYEFGDPDRFDVFVFKYPEEPKTNYIKRLVGLPGELIRIQGGSVYKVTDEGVEILRKSPFKQRQLQIPVYDDNFPPDQLLEAGWPERWSAMKQGEIGQLGNWSDSSTGWKADANAREYSVSSENTERSWLRYRHYFPSQNDWFALKNGRDLNPQASLIADFCSYNAYTGMDVMRNRTTANSVDVGKYWVRDLTINFDLDIQEIKGDSEIIIELCEGTTWYQCVINPDTGVATLLDINTQPGTSHNRNFKSKNTHHRTRKLQHQLRQRG